MTPAALRDLLRQGEGQRLEFKEDAIKSGDLAQTLVGMANAQGGVLLLGVNDAGQPVGIHSYKEAVDLVMTAASHELCDPPIRLTQLTSVVLPDGVQALAVTVPRSRKLHATHGRFMVRRGSQNVALTTMEVAERSRRVETGGLTLDQVGHGRCGHYPGIDRPTRRVVEPRGGPAEEGSRPGRAGPASWGGKIRGGRASARPPTPPRPAPTRAHRGHPRRVRAQGA